MEIEDINDEIRDEQHLKELFKEDEIKEINITFPGQILDYVDTKEHLLDLFNYITNLQEDYDRAMKLVDKGVENSYIKLKEQQKEIQRYKKFVDDILNFYMHNRYEEELTEDNMFKFVLNQNEMIMTIEEFKGGK